MKYWEGGCLSILSTSWQGGLALVRPPWCIRSRLPWRLPNVQPCTSTVLGEPPLKLLRYQQQFTFFDAGKVNSSIRFVSIANDVLEAGLGKVLEGIVKEVEAVDPRFVIVDSFRSVIRASQGPEPGGELDLQAFVQRLALQLTSWQATTFLVGEYQDVEKDDNPIFTVADGILWLTRVFSGVPSCEICRS